MNNLKIALDLDGTLADIIGLWLSEYNKKNSKRLRYADIVRWDFWSELGYTASRFFKELSDCWNKWMDVKPMESNISYTINQLKNFGMIDIVTARDPRNTFNVKNWLMMHNINYNNYVLVSYGTDKAELEYDLFIDDSPLNAKKIARYKKRVILYDQPWNRNIEEDRYIIRIKSLADTLDIIPQLI
ncbi:MAG: hypothetical protein QW416_04695 [Candidatus Nitrosocaldaceae archaeon]